MGKFKNGIRYVNVASAITKRELTTPKKFNVKFNDYTISKFIPASGAATRMFKNLYTYAEEREDNEFVDYFFEYFEEFAFYDELKSHIDMKQLDRPKVDDRILIIQNLLNNQMNYSKLPKALITFHQYEDGITNPIDEHIYEGELYLDSNQVNLHFTIAPEHEELFNAYVEEVTEDKNHIHITYSFQKEYTDTIAVDLNNKPFYLENGDILYRPGGHGALLENLNELEEDIIFIKNIDNVVHRSQIEDTIESKKMLAAIGVEVKEQIDTYIDDLLSDAYDLAEINAFIKETLNISLKDEMTKERALGFLNRPLRVAGVVKNEGEPGGGPYVVDNGDYYDLQICEKSEIDLNDEEQREILNNSEYFNPVDLVCFTKDYKGDKFNLMDYANEERYFISEKTHEGRPLKALEHPGLWNGAMHHWNTLFVEVPLSTFNPVKNVNDLLKEGHRAVEVKVNNK
jgi:hypothetical protein